MEVMIPLPRPPIIDPEVLFGLMLIGALVGALSTAVTYIGSKVAESEGRSLRQLPTLPGLIEQQ